MQCDICSRTGGSKLPFLCPTDARNQLYDGRIRQAHILIENEALSRQVDEVIARSGHAQKEAPKNISDSTSSEDLNAQTSWDHSQAVVEKEQAADRTRDIIARADELRSKIESARADIEKRKTSIARRKSEFASAVNGIEARRSKLLEEAEKKTKVTRFKWNQLHYTATHSRSFLCGEAAKLYGLRRRRADDLWEEEYGIGGVGIMDLRSMNTASPAQITTALSHMAHLLVLCSHYLAIQLPAEITLPHRDYPLPTIFSLPASHMNHKVPFPGNSSQSGSNSPTATVHEVPNLPRPRPLFIQKPLPLLVKEDPSTYASFVEGTGLLAYDIAWVCKSQGIPVGESSSFEDICDLGHNLFNLLIGNQPRPGLPSRANSTQSSPSKNRDRDGSDATAEDSQSRKTVAAIGHFSHGTAHTFLAGTEGSEFVRSWKLPSPLKIADRLKAHLLAELHNAEWEVLDQNAWAEAEGEDDGVVVGGGGETRARGKGGDSTRANARANAEARMRSLATQSFLSMRTVPEGLDSDSGGGVGLGSDDGAGAGVGGVERKPGTSGWTKLKPR